MFIISIILPGHVFPVFPDSSTMSASESETNVSKQDHKDALIMELTCPICLQLFSEPVSLPCRHVYCFACLRTMGEGLDQHSCPECQAEYCGTKALVKNFKMRSIVETYKARAKREGSASDPSDVGHVTEDGTEGRAAGESNTKYLQEAEAGDLKESLGCEGKRGFQIRTGSSEDTRDQEHTKSKGKMEMDEPKFRLALQATELSLKLEMAEGVLTKEKEQENEVAIANSQLREKASTLLAQMKELLQNYSTRVMELIEEELGPGEASIQCRVGQASELTSQLRQAIASAESLMTEEDGTEFTDKLQTLQPHIVELLAKPVGEDPDHIESKVNPARACPKLEMMNGDLRDRFGKIQRSLRNSLNPSEVTFDPETLHPNLLLSEDLKTVTFSAAKQPYPPSPQRFTSFFQVLSSQSFYGGEHCWEVELEGSPWIIGVCYSAKLERSGLPSALESSRSSWCLMWFNNLLTAFEQSHSVPLKRTTVSCRLEIRLSFKTHRLSIYNVSPISGKTHVYTFKTNLSEPVHLAYRMMSGHPKARVTVY